MTDDQRLRLIPLVVAFPLFLQNLDAYVIATALPTMAASLKVPVLDLNLAITAYLLSLAVFLPASAWLAARFGAKRVFILAVLLFSLGSALCGLADSVPALVGFRIVQGMGGALMVPVGRSLLLRAVPPQQLVRAMVWFTVPGAVGRVLGPALGGLLVTVAPWRWIFFLSVPFALLGAALAMRFVDDDRADADRQPAAALDARGLLLLAVGLGGLLGGIETAGKGMVAPMVTALMVLGGALCLALYVRHSRHAAAPALDLALLRFRAFRLCLLGGVPVRIALGAAPFLLPLMLQVGFGLSALDSGVLTMALALGALSARPALAWAIRTLGFRSLLIGASVLAACFYAAYGFFRPGTPQPMMFAVLFCGGLCTSVIMVTLNTVGYAQIPRASSGHASALASMVQQLSMAVGVVLGAGTVSLSSHVRGASGAPSSGDFTVAFWVLSLLALCSAAAFRRFRAEDGRELRPPPRRED